jgi:pilus assembly protein CpaB
MRKRSGLLIILTGVVIAFIAGLMVLSLTRQAAAQATGQVKQVFVVMAARDIPEGAAISADALTVQAFPADFVPQGAIPAPEQAVGKYTTTRVTKGQIMLVNQLSTTKRAGNLALSVPVGKVAMALPMTDLLSANGAIKPGDHVDVLLTLNLLEIQARDQPAGAPLGNNVKNPVTQMTLQNVEVLSVGVPDDGSGANGVPSSGSGQRSQTAMIVLLDHQDALVLKYVKDSGGVIDLALRAPDDTTQVKTNAVTIDVIFEQFNFRRPAPIP